MLCNTQFDDAGAIVATAGGTSSRDGDARDGRVDLLATVVRTLDEFQTRGLAGATRRARSVRYAVRHADRRVRTVVDALERVVGSRPGLRRRPRGSTRTSSSAPVGTTSS